MDERWAFYRKVTRRLVALIVVCSVLTACGTHSVLSSPLTQEAAYPAVAPEKIAVFVTDETPFPYRRIAHLSAMVDAGNNPRVPVEILKEEAAAIGADAIVELRLNYGSGFFTRGLKATGTAVKFTE